MSMTDEFIFTSTDSKCPVCGSSNIENYDHDFDADAVYVSCRCNECDSRFTFGYWVKDVYIDSDGRTDDV